MSSPISNCGIRTNLESLYEIYSTCSTSSSTELVTLLGNFSAPSSSTTSSHSERSFSTGSNSTSFSAEDLTFEGSSVLQVLSYTITDKEFRDELVLRVVDNQQFEKWRSFFIAQSKSVEQFDKSTLKIKCLSLEAYRFLQKNCLNVKFLHTDDLSIKIEERICQEIARVAQLYSEKYEILRNMTLDQAQTCCEECTRHLDSYDVISKASAHLKNGQAVSDCCAEIQKKIKKTHNFLSKLADRVEVLEQVLGDFFISVERQIMNIAAAKLFGFNLECESLRKKIRDANDIQYENLSFSVSES